MIKDIVNVAKGELKADLIIKNANIINVFTNEIYKSDVAIIGGKIAGIGTYDNAEKVIDINGKYLSPGFIDGHVHLESSMVLPYEFAKSVMPAGTTSVVCDPHEIANVLGLQGINFIRDTSRNIPLDVYVMLPSCVPATDMETSGDKLTSNELSVYMNKEWVLGLAEMMNFPGVINLDEGVIKKLELFKNKRIDGHAPSLSGNNLCAYIAGGISSDHECTTPEEAEEKLKLGMYIMIREGTVAKDLEALLPAINEKNASRCIFVTDDRCPNDLEDHINSMVRTAVKKGLSPITAIKMASFNTAEYFNIKKLGAIAPSYSADLLVFDNLEDFNPEMVIKNGKIVAKNGVFVEISNEFDYPKVRGSMNVKWIEKDDFKIKAETNKVKIIDIIPKQLVTNTVIDEIIIQNGYAEADTSKDILKIAVIERHKGSGNIGLGFVRGFGLKGGAIASTVAHDSHNLVIIGTNDEDMYTAATALVKAQGGKVVVNNGEVIELLPLPIAGLMSHKDIDYVKEKVISLAEKSKEIGCKLDDPFMNMAFLSLPVIPDLKITDFGLFDVNKFHKTELFI